MSDLVILELIKFVFYGSLAITILILFRAQIRNFLDSVGSFQVAGASFKLGDGRATAESYAVLAEILVAMLSRLENISPLIPVISLPQVEQLGQFAIKYMGAVPREKWSEEMLRNIACLLTIAGRAEQSIALFEDLLKGRPDHFDFLDHQGNALLRHGGLAQLERAEEMFVKLVARDPSCAPILFRLASVQSRLKKVNDAIVSLRKCVELKFFKSADVLMDPVLMFAREAEPRVFEEIRVRINLLLAEAVPEPTVSPTVGGGLT